MFEVRLHGALWKKVTPARADEWRRALDEINAENTLACGDLDLGDEPAVELVRLPNGSFVLRLYRGAFEQAAAVELDDAGVQEHFGEYSATIRQMVHVDREAPIRGFEALDYAKRLVHDEAAAWLMERLRPAVAIDLSDARRLFTLLFLVGTDLPEELVRYHRLH